jgi:hypothetical protein
MNVIIIVRGIYLNAYKVQNEFSDNTSRVIDFEPFFKNSPHPQWEKYNKLFHFRKFKIENGNLVWGSNWDLIFSLQSLYTGNLIEQCS